MSRPAPAWSPPGAQATAARPSPTEIDGRLAFVARVVEAFEDADVEYVLLHAYGVDRPADSDLDVAVTRGSLRTVDAIVRSGALGRLVQCFHYDVPWCRWYVVQTDEAERGYRQLDVACDPWGIGRYGPAVPLALSERDASSGVSIPRTAAEVVYLAVKRACKGFRRRDDRGQLLSAFRRDPDGASTLLEERFGHVGASLGAALEEGKADLTPELTALRRLVDRRRRRPRLLARRALFGSLRLVRRIVSPTGLVVCLIGPDGVGKTTLAEGLADACRGAFRSTVRLHVRPGLLPAPARLLGRPPADGREPHGKPPSSTVGSVARLAYLWLDVLAGWLLRIAVARVRSSLVIVERGWLDLAVDPRRYRLSLPGSLVRGLVRLLPRPDLVLLLDAPPASIHARKQELPAVEIDRQLCRWRELAAREPARFAVLDASGSEAAVLAEARRRIDDRLACRQRTLTAGGVAFLALGRPSRTGTRYTVTARRRRPRWILPARAGAPGPSGAGLYRAARTRHRVGALGLELLQRSGAGRLLPCVTLDLAEGLGPVIAAELGVPRIELAAAATRDDHRGGRALLSVLSAGRPVAFAKVACEEAPKLAHERDVLQALARASLARLAVPEVLAYWTWRDCAVLMLRPLPAAGRTDRALGVTELGALVELAALAGPLAPLLGRREGLVPTHGDFAPWNCGPTNAGALALWDWEDTRLGLPLEDLFHWRVQRLVLFGEEDTEALVNAAISPDPETRWLSRETGTRPEIAPAALRAALERGPSAGRAPNSRDEHVRSLALARLEEALR